MTDLAVLSTFSTVNPGLSLATSQSLDLFAKKNGALAFFGILQHLQTR